MKKISALLIILVVVVTLAGCGNGEGESITDITSNNGNEVDFSFDDDRTLAELSNMDGIMVPMGEFDNYRFHTNSTQISVSVPYIEHSGTILLRDAFNSEEIQRFTLDQHNREGVFTNLTSAANYLIVASGFGRDDTTIFVISD